MTLPEINLGQYPRQTTEDGETPDIFFFRQKTAAVFLYSTFFSWHYSASVTFVANLFLSAFKKRTARH